MKIISTKTHGVLDYLVGILLIAAPWLLGFADGTAAQKVPLYLGVLTLLLAMCTNYEAGLIKVISMRAHLTMDVLTGIFLAASPWLLGFADRVYLPHLIVGILEVGAAVMTRSVVGARTSATAV